MSWIITAHCGQVWSWRTGVVCSCSQVEVVGVVMEHQQGVEVLSSSQDSVFSAPPWYWTVNKTMNRQGHPGLQLRLLQVTPAAQEKGEEVTVWMSLSSLLNFNHVFDIQKPQVCQRPQVWGVVLTWAPGRGGEHPEAAAVHRSRLSELDSALSSVLDKPTRTGSCRTSSHWNHRRTSDWCDWCSFEQNRKKRVQPSPADVSVHSSEPFQEAVGITCSWVRTGQVCQRASADLRIVLWPIITRQEWLQRCSAP